MGLQASLYSGITGLNAHGERMSVIGNNLANVNTIGFKGARMDFEDVMSQDIFTSAGVGQVGRGVRVAAIYADFSQGSLESTNESTDLAITGDGFFIVSPLGSEDSYYTRAGNFRFDNDGYLVDPHGYALQGWEVQQSDNTVSSATTTGSSSNTRIVGTPTDIRLENFQSPPQYTTEVTMVTNLDPNTTSRSNSLAGNPYFAMFENWDSTSTTGVPLSENAYAYSSTIKVYDEIGTGHNLTVYFDQVTLSGAGGDTAWEYVVTVDPSEDGRKISGADGNLLRMDQTSAAGVLMVGTLTFRSGQLDRKSTRLNSSHYS